VLISPPASLSLSQPRFAGYRLDRKDEDQTQARLFLPGHAPNSAYAPSSSPAAEVIAPGETKVQSLRLHWNEKHDVWEAQALVPAGTKYRFLVDGESKLDLVHTVKKKDLGYRHPEFNTDNPDYNQIALNSHQAPTRSTVIADIYLDSLVNQELFQKLQKENHGVTPIRDHFNRFAPNQGLQSLREALPALRQGGFTGLLFKPFIGGDNLTSHRYWTVDPYRLNDTFKNKEEYRQALLLLLKNNMKLYADGAFVNQGLNGIQILSNLAHNYRSPYWSWFRNSENTSEEPPPPYVKEEQLSSYSGKEPPPYTHLSLAEEAVRWDYPRHANEEQGYIFGILPSKRDKETGLSQLNFERFDFKIENNPKEAGYDPVRPIFVKLFDPSKNKTLQNPGPSNSSDSVHEFRFPVTKKEILKKLDQTKGMDTDQIKLAMTQWKRFRLTTPRADDSGRKWDGKIDVALMNTDNPEVQRYLQGAVVYWSHLSLNTQIEAVSKALRGKLAGKDSDAISMQAALDAITVRSEIAQDWEDPQRVLPPVSQVKLDRLTRNEINRTLANVQKQNHISQTQVALSQSGSKLSKTILDEIPLSVLPLPDLFKGILSAPDLPKLMRSNSLAAGAETGPAAESNLRSQKGVLGSLFKKPTLEDQLGEKLQASIQQLPPTERQKLEHPKIRSLVGDRLGEALFLHLLTGLDIVKLSRNEFSTQEIEDHFYKTVPPRINNTDPQFGARQLLRYLQKKLQHREILQPETLAPLLEDILKPLDPAAVAVAEQILQKRELGLNWRIDAAKDVADTHRIRETIDLQRKPIFKQQMQQMQNFWEGLAKAMRKSFPQSTLIAELTNLDELSGSKTLEGRNESERKLLLSLFSSNTFTSMPNMRYLYSQLMQLTHHDQRPDENGGSQISPSQYLDDVLHPMSKALPLTALQQMQNLVCSHDHNTATQTLMLNPALTTMDLQKHWGLKDDLRNAMSELRDKACFRDTMADLNALPGAEDIGTHGFIAFFDKLSELLELNNKDADFNLDEGLVERLKAKSPKLLPFLSKKSKTEAFGEQRYITPFDMKASFVDAIFDALESHEREDLGLAGNLKQATPEQRVFEKKLRGLLKQRMTEPSEAKAMRGAIVNSVLALRGQQPTMNLVESEEIPEVGKFWKQTAETLKLSKEEGNELQKGFEKSLWIAIDKTIEKWDRHFGYQAPDVALNHVFQNLDTKLLTDVLPGLKNQPEALSALKANFQKALYGEMLKPVLPKLLRIFAVQNALPGNPSVYLPDWIAQGGGEWEQNVFVQNRALINPQALKGKPQGLASEDYEKEFQRFQERAGAIFRTRTQGLEVPNRGKKTLGPAALNEGVLLNVAADDEKGVLPLVRDNGREQVITLVSTGQPARPKDWDNKVGADTIGYEAFSETEAPLRDYRSQLQSSELIPGRTYRDAINGERFRLGEDGALMSLKKPGYGIDIDDFRILIRELKHFKL
jgi:hypothetical protein